MGNTSTPNLAASRQASIPQGNALSGLVPGLLLVSAIAVAATWLAQAPWLAQHGLSALTVGIVLGMVAGNLVPAITQGPWAGGIQLSKQKLLRLGIILYGLRLTFQDIAQLGWSGLAVDAAMLGSTFVLAQWLGRRWLGIDSRTCLLIGAGSSICGAAAVLATAPVAKGRAEDVSIAIATVVVFGTLGTFLYPALQLVLELPAHAYGLWVGSSVHEVAQVVAAAQMVGPEAANSAVIAKMLRVMMLAPFLVMLSVWLARKDASAERRESSKKQSSLASVTIPWFALGFVAVAGIHSLQVIPEPAVHWGTALDNFVLTMAMIALGMTTQMRAIKDAGLKPLLLAALLFVWLVGAGLLLNTWLA
ncbi:MAG: YeiH family protein [Comamonas sp.]